MGFHSTTILGNLGGDAEVGQAGEMPLVTFSVAVTEKYNNKQGELQSRTEWYRASAFGKRWSNLARYLTKGKSVLVTGKMRTDTYEKEGVKHYSTKLIVDNIEFAGGGKKEETDSEVVEDADSPF